MHSEDRVWQTAMSNLITDPNELFSILNLDSRWLDKAYEVAKVFPLKVTHSFVARMEKGNLHDPLLQQVLPIDQELEEVVGYQHDPLHELKSNPIPGMLHKYLNRVLVTLTSACAVHCRYCFRRHFPYADNNPGRRGWEKIFAYICQHEAINEVILSGGDPLSVSDQLLAQFCDQLTTIPHIKHLRFHSRIPVILPQRITSSFIQWIRQLPLSVVMVIHMNHPNEMSEEVIAALKKLRDAGVMLLNQAVLLKGINDNVTTLAKLSETLFSAGVLPYYLHVLDKVQGTAHFDLPLQEAEQLHRELTNRLSGYLVPKLVREDPGAMSKTIL